MCNCCATDVRFPGAPASSSRRAVLGVIGAMSLMGIATKVQASQSPPKPDNVLSPDEALERLMAGNKRYISGETNDRNYSASRTALASGQNPYACVLSCADSRVSPELCFDEERGDLFVTRVAGNYVTNDILASLEYAVAVLHSPLIMVLGHTRCGAVSATVSSLEQKAEFPGHIQTIVTALMPAVRSVSSQSYSGSLTEAATLENIRQNVRRLEESTPIMSRAARNNQVKVVGGIYDLTTGRVELVQ